MDTLKAKVENDFDDVEMQAALSAMQDTNQLHRVSHIKHTHTPNHAHTHYYY